MTLPANIRVNASVPFPATVKGSGVIAVTKLNNIWTISLNFAALATSPIVTDPNNTYLLAWNAITGAYAGFYDNVNSPFGTVTVNYTTTITDASGLAGYVEVVYAYNTTATTPEPVSLMLCGTGLLALALFAQRRLARR